MYFLPLHPVLLKGVCHARRPPMWPGFGSWRRRHMWVEFVVDSLLCSERFFSGYSRFSPLLKNQKLHEFQIPIRLGIRPDEEPLCGCATSKLLFIYLLFQNLTVAHQNW